jgi:hypothetical protein
MVVAPVIAGVAIVGLVPKTSAPVPVSSVTAAAKLADDGVAKKVATPAPRPDIDAASTAVATKSTPFHATTLEDPAGIVTPVVGPTPRITMLWVLEVLLMTM